MQSMKSNMVKPKQKQMTTKCLGELGEMLFTAQAALHGFSVAVPCGESHQYDRIVDNGNLCLRVQVKATSGTTSPGIYYVDCTHRTSKARAKGKKKVAYTKDEIDFLVIYVLPEDAWYIIPVEALRGRLILALHVADHPQPGNMEAYKDSWHLLWKGGKKEKATSGIIPSLMAAAEVFDGVPVEYPEEFAREFTCHVIGASRIDFKVWTDGEPPTPEAVARILGVLIGDNNCRAVLPVENGNA